MSAAVVVPDTARRRLAFLGPSLADCMARGGDNFLLLRFLAAALVIFGHSWATANNPTHATDWLGQQTWVFSGTVAVDIFFGVSGFLVTMSFVRRPSLLVFAASRILRIFPALIVCVLLSALLLGPLVTTLSVHDYFHHPETRSYIVENIWMKQVQWMLPGVFESNAHKGVVNGCLWTLPGEIRMYEFVLALGALGLLRNAGRFVFGLAALMATVLLFPALPLLQQPEYMEFAAFFAGGALCFFFRDRLPVSGYILLALALLIFPFRGQSAYFVAFRVLVAYATLWFAYGLRLPTLERFGDYSYGLYLYGFPIQQVVALWRPDWGPWQSLTVSLPTTLLLAMASWHLVEKPMLRFKPRPRSAQPALNPAGANAA